MSSSVSQEYIEKMTAEEMYQDNRQYFTCESSLIDEIGEKNSDALAIWVYLTSKPKTWRIYPEVVKEKLGIGRRRYSAAVAVLKEVGVVRQKSIKAESAGKFAGKVTFISNYRPNPTKAVCSDQRNLPEAVTVDGSYRRRTCPLPVGTIVIDTELPIDTEIEKEKDNNSASAHLSEKPNRDFTLDRHARLLTPVEREEAQHCEHYKTFSRIYRSCGGKVINTDCFQFMKSVPKSRYAEFALGLQNCLNAKSQNGTSLQNFDKFLREGSWEDQDVALPGPVFVPGSPSPPDINSGTNPAGETSEQRVARLVLERKTKTQLQHITPNLELSHD